MGLKLFIDGAAGTTGLEIADRTAGRGDLVPIVLDEAERKSPSARRDALNAADIAILCLPDDAARQAVAMLDPGGATRIIDASSAHRTAPGWANGFPELVGRDRIAQARLVSNPGCYPTGFLALIAPLVRGGLLPGDWPYTVNAVSGYSGGGKSMIDRFEHDRRLAYRAYGMSLDHKHLGEMQTYAQLRHAPVFSPAVIPAMRGMIVDVPLSVAAMPGSVDAAGLHGHLHQHYCGQRLVRVMPISEEPVELLLYDEMEPWDGIDLHVYANRNGTQARLIARLDNLGKGAGGAAVQTLNLMAGVDEYTGLRLGG